MLRVSDQDLSNEEWSCLVKLASVHFEQPPQTTQNSPSSCCCHCCSNPKNAQIWPFAARSWLGSIPSKLTSFKLKILLVAFLGHVAGLIWDFEKPSKAGELGSWAAAAKECSSLLCRVLQAAGVDPGKEFLWRSELAKSRRKERPV